MASWSPEHYEMPGGCCGDEADVSPLAAIPERFRAARPAPHEPYTPEQYRARLAALADHSDLQTWIDCRRAEQ